MNDVTPTDPAAELGETGPTPESSAEPSAEPSAELTAEPTAEPT